MPRRRLRRLLEALSRRLAADDLSTPDVLTVSRSGAIIAAPEKDIRTGQWKYRIEGIAADRRFIAVVFTFASERAILITVFERTR